MAVAMVAMLAFGGTYAYFTASSKAVENKELKTGIVQVTVGDVVNVTDTTLVTKHKVLEAVNVSAGATNVKTYFFVTFDMTITGSDGVEIEDHSEILNAAAAINTTDWKAVTGVDNVYYQLWESAESFDGAFTSTALTVTADPHWAEDDEQPVEMGATISITLKAEAIQAFNGYDDSGVAQDFANAEAAWEALQTKNAANAG